jgi:predicted transposase YbfD/YdcC
VEELKRTNEIKMAIPLLEAIDIQGKQVTADALLTQRKLADYLVRKRKAHYHFTVKANQPRLFQDIQLYFQNRQQPDFVDDACCEHGRIEIRKIWTTTELNPYLNFPHVAQAFVIERQCTDKKSGEHSHETAYGITSTPPEQANPKRVLATNRGHWSI